MCPAIIAQFRRAPADLLDATRGNNRSRTRGAIRDIHVAETRIRRPNASMNVIR